MNPPRTGRVVAHFGKKWAVEEGAGRVYLCHPLRRSQEPCVGDRVHWEAADAEHGRILEVLPRDTLLTRPGRGGKTRPAAANVSQVLVVLAPEPPYDLLLVDQYLVVNENRGIDTRLVFNKSDLLTEASRRGVDANLAPYRDLYPLLFISAETGEGMAALKATLKDKISMLAGQSGVGKSSLLKNLLPDLDVRIGGLSDGTRRGRHTTTSAMLFHLPGGGDLIDTPGVAIFGLADIDSRQLAEGYKEFRPLIPYCRFNDCRHVDDLGCAVREGVEKGEISRARYRRYLKLLEKLPRIS
ncbi:MAG: ribosome small subunit-dependent GTPase A [Methylothermaceae bacterium]|nr:ribosome small subunit-dependent GTPase A [Methylothermaceae bacterium]